MPETPIFERKITRVERLFTRSPFSLVTMVARIKGSVTEQALRQAILQVQRRHTHLRVRIREDHEHTPYFTSEGAGDIPVEVVARESDEHWMQVQQEASQVPFEFEQQPAIRFILVYSPAISELVILCHHILCDGLSLAYLARDILLQLGDPARVVEALPDPHPIDLDNLPQGLSQSGLVRYFIQRINRQWQADPTYFDQEDYRDLAAAYWQHFHHEMIPVELSEAETTALVERCRAEGVTVNSALAIAFAGAQVSVQGPRPFHSSIFIAGSLRDRLPSPPGEAMGFYAGSVTLKYRYDESESFWENARRFHRKARPLFTDKNLFKEFLSWFYLEPAILEALNFKKLGGLVPAQAARHAKLAAFSQKDDVVATILKREKMDSLERQHIGTAVTNLTRMDFPRKYGALELDRLILHPGGAFPLVNVNLVLGAVTCAGKLSLVLEFAREALDMQTAGNIRDKALEYLLAG
ncbi:MAG: condensation domain-containing protein [Chloroflexota bacterium]